MGPLCPRTVTHRLAAVVPALTLLAGVAPAQEQEHVFRVDVRLVRILATVKNTAGQPVGNLERSDFEVRDNGVPQEIALFERHTEQPLSVALLIDTSASTAIDLKYQIDSVQRFLRALFGEGNPDDALALYSFNWETVQHTGFTRRIGLFEKALKGLRSAGGTSMYDAICFASQALEGREGRHVIVMVTDGGDTTSAKSFHDALEAAQRADAVIYPVLVMPIKADAGRNIAGENALTTMAERTGGRIFLPTLGAALDDAFVEILRDLRTQYLIGFYPKEVPPSKDSFHRLDIKVRRPDLRVLARSGYYRESEGGTGWRPVR